MRRRLGAVAVAAGLVFGLPACDGAEQPRQQPSVAAPDLDAIRAAREAYAQPATLLGTLARQVEVDVRVLRFEVPPSGDDGSPDLEARTFLLDQATGAVDDLATLLAAPAPEVDQDEPAVAAAAAAWQSASEAAESLVEAAREEVELAMRLVDVEQRLADTAALWDEPGSRAEQTQRLDEAADEAEAHAASLADLLDVPACATAAARRVAAAELVAHRTRELHGYVARGQGRSFDEARASFDEEPWYLGLVDLDATERACWDRSSKVVASANAVIGALDGLVAALNTGTAPEGDVADLPGDEPSSG